MSIKLSKLITCVDCEKAVVQMGDGVAEIFCESDDIQHRNLFAAKGKSAASQCSGFKHLSRQRGGEVNLKDALRYMLAGKSEFTMLSIKSGVRLRYKLTKKESKYKGEDGASEFIYFLNTFTDGDMQYAGVLFYNDDNNTFNFGKGARGKLQPSHLNVRSILYVLNNLTKGNEDLALKVYHSGKCGRCGRKLTTPESVLTGLGPTCSKVAGVPRVKIK